MINFSPASIDETYNEIDAASDGEYLVVNGDSEIIYSNTASYVGRSYKKDFSPRRILFSTSPSASPA